MDQKTDQIPKTRIDQKFKVFYRLSTHGTLSDWQELEMKWDCPSLAPFTEIDGPSLLEALHWRGAELHRAIKPMLSESTHLESLVVTEVVKEPEPKKPELSRSEGKPIPGKTGGADGHYKGPYRIFIKEQSDTYWLDELFFTEKQAMARRAEIKNAPLGSCFMVMVYDPEFNQLTES